MTLHYQAPLIPVDAGKQDALDILRLLVKGLREHPHLKRELQEILHDRTTAPSEEAV